MARSTKGRDLSLNRPGEAARAKLEQDREIADGGHPVLAAINRALTTTVDDPALRARTTGEEKVGTKLEKLIPYGWRVLNAVPLGKGDSQIDHVLIGPGGVYTISSKYLPHARVVVEEHQIYINREPVDFLDDSIAEGKRAKRLLTKAAGFPVNVKPSLVILVGGIEPMATYRKRPTDVLVLDAWNVRPVFKRRTGVLDDDAVEALFEVARWESTWR